jgi:NitT/TauT family transport system ATP-binding protein
MRFDAAFAKAQREAGEALGVITPHDTTPALTKEVH